MKQDTKEERKKREEKRRLKSEKCGNYDQVFTFENLYKSGKKCIRGVRWKASIQNYARKPISNTYALYKSLKERKFEFSKPFIFWINERGKERKIQAQKITERVVQRTLCDKVIVPLFDKSFIYDNAANRLGKGIDHTLDHYIKDKLRVKCYARYVDDFYFFAETKEQAKELLEKITNKINELGLKLNEKKTRIQKISKGFKFLKTKFFCTESGKVIRKINRKSKTFKRWIDEGRFTKEQAYNAYFSWKGHMQRGNSYMILNRMDNYIQEILEN